MSKKPFPPTALHTIATGWQDVFLICKKCSKKLGGGFGDQGATTLRKAMRGRLRDTGQRHLVGLIDAPCFGVCPKHAVTVAHTSNPSELLIVPAGVSLEEVLSFCMAGVPDAKA